MKRYSDLDTARILTRAAELSAHHAIGAREGSSLEELEHIAKEAGLDVAMVRRAALDLAQDESGNDPDLLRSGFHLCAEVDGTLDDAGRQAVLHEVRARFPLARVKATAASLLVLESPFGVLCSVASSGTTRTRVVLDCNHHFAPKISTKLSFALAVAPALVLATLGETLAEAALIAAGTSMATAMLAGIVWACRPLDRALKQRRRAGLTRALEGVLAVVRAHSSSTQLS
jgi:hypothetical protein